MIAIYFISGLLAGSAFSSIIIIVRFQKKLKIKESLLQSEIDHRRKLESDIVLYNKKLKFAIHNKPKHKIGKLIGDYEVMDIDVVEKGFWDYMPKGLIGAIVCSIAYLLSKKKSQYNPELTFKYKVKNKITGQEMWSTME